MLRSRRPPKSTARRGVAVGRKRGFANDAFYWLADFAPLSANATENWQNARPAASSAIRSTPALPRSSILGLHGVDQTAIDDPDTDIVIIDAELPKAA